MLKCPKTLYASEIDNYYCKCAENEKFILISYLNLFLGGANHAEPTVCEPRWLRETDRRRGVPEPWAGSLGRRRGPRTISEHAQYAGRDAAPDHPDAKVLPAQLPGSLELGCQVTKTKVNSLYL